MTERLRIIRKKSAREKLGIANSTLCNWTNPKCKYFNPNFPKPIRIGSVVGFLEHELDAFILEVAQRKEIEGKS